MLFDSIDEGFCLVEVLFEEEDKPVDYRFLEVNPSFEKQTGLIDARGKSMRQLAPQHEEYWFQTYGKVALTGQADPFPEPRRTAAPLVRRLRFSVRPAGKKAGCHPF